MRPGRTYLAGSPIFTAHRGGAGLAPENTMAAFRNAVENWGVDMLELDVRATRDGVLVVIHDESVDRTTDGRGRVADLNWDEIRQMDAGHNFLDPQGRPTYRGRGVGIPTFQELLEVFPHMRLNVEAKESRAAGLLVDQIRSAGAEDRVLVAAEFEKSRKPAAGYKGPWGASRLQVTTFFFLLHAPLGFFYTPACDVLQVPEEGSGLRVVTPRFVREAHRRNLPVHVWTVNDPQAMRRLLAMGVDGIQTDRPDLLAPILTEVLGRPPAPCLAKRAGERQGGGG